MVKRSFVRLEATPPPLYLIRRPFCYSCFYLGSSFSFVSGEALGFGFSIASNCRWGRGRSLSFVSGKASGFGFLTAGN